MTAPVARANPGSIEETLAMLAGADYVAGGAGTDLLYGGHARRR